MIIFCFILMSDYKVIDHMFNSANGAEYVGLKEAAMSSPLTEKLIYVNEDLKDLTFCNHYEQIKYLEVISLIPVRCVIAVGFEHVNAKLIYHDRIQNTLLNGVNSLEFIIP